MIIDAQGSSALERKVSSHGMSRRKFFGVIGMLTAACATFEPSRMRDGYDSPRSLHRPTGPYITEQDYPPMNSAISEDVPGDWSRSIGPAHRGAGNMDIAAKTDGSTKVVPAAIGDISEAAYDSGNGWYVTMRHGLGFATSYGHLKKVNERILRDGKFQRGMVLTPEDEIGNAGNTGTGAKGFYHLGFMLIVPPYVEPNNQFTTINERTGQTATGHGAQRAGLWTYRDFTARRVRGWDIVDLLPG